MKGIKRPKPTVSVKTLKRAHQATVAVPPKKPHYRVFDGKRYSYKGFVYYKDYWNSEKERLKYGGFLYRVVPKRTLLKNGKYSTIYLMYTRKAKR